MSIRITRSRGIHVDTNAARLGSEGGKEPTVNSKKHTTPAPIRKSKCARLTPTKRGRLWQSVGDTTAAAGPQAAGRTK